MHQGLARMIVAVAVISVVSYSAILAGYYIQAAGDLGEGSIIEKGLELGGTLYENSTVVIRGISTGSRQMSTFQLGVGNVSISLSGDSIFWSFPKNALIVSNLSLHRDLDAVAVSGDPQSPVLMLEANGSFLIRPQAHIAYERDEGDISGRTVHRLSISSCYLSDFSASGRFDLLKETSEVIVSHYQRECLYDCTVTVFLDTGQAASFQARAGEKVLVESLHYNVRLEPMPRQ